MHNFMVIHDQGTPYLSHSFGELRFTFDVHLAYSIAYPSAPFAQHIQCCKTNAVCSSGTWL